MDEVGISFLIFFGYLSLALLLAAFSASSRFYKIPDTFEHHCRLDHVNYWPGVGYRAFPRGR